MAAILKIYFSSLLLNWKASSRNLVGNIGVTRRSKIAKFVPIVNPSWLPFRVCSNDQAQLTGMPYIFFFKIKNCLNDDLFISCDDRIGRMLHNICISAVAMSLRWATRGPWASCFSKKFQHICVSLDVNFNEWLTNDVVSFEQLGPGWGASNEYLQHMLTWRNKKNI